MVQTAIRAKKLLQAAAQEQEFRTKTINKKEIKTKIDEIKYLSTQKNVPRLSLRKEIVHLENKLQSIFELEEKLMKKEKHESNKVNSLKRQIKSLKDRLNSTEDRELRLKVEKLYHILTELLAKSELKKDVELSNSLLQELQQVDPDLAAKEKSDSNAAYSLKVRRIAMLLHRINSVKHELELKAELHSANPKILEEIKKKIDELGIKIEDLSKKYPDAVEYLKVQEQKEEEKVEKTNSEVKHTMIMNHPGPTQGENESGLVTGAVAAVGAIDSAEEEKIQDEVIAELPLPPPPKIRKK